MIMDAIAFSSTTHAVIPLVGLVITLNCLLKGFRQGAPSLFLIGPGQPFPILVKELEISREPPTRVGLQVGVPCEIPLALALRKNHCLQGQQNKVCRPGWQHAAPGTAIKNAGVWVIGPNRNQSP
jgi:hypothetical protein